MPGLLGDAPEVGGLLGKQPPAKPAKRVVLDHMRPFQPGEYIDNGDGSYSTEITHTIQTPDGLYANVPSLWMTPGGYANLGDDEDAITAAVQAYESRAGHFPRFKNVEEAVSAAKARSHSGGVFNGNLAK